MSGKFRALLFWGAFCPSAILLAQNTGNIPLLMEELLYRSEREGLAEEFSELYEESRLIKVNLNTCNREQLEETGLFTPFQIYQLLKYRKRFGAFYSIFELRVIPGFHRTQLQVLKPFVEFYTNSQNRISSGQKFLLMMDLMRTHPASLAYLESPPGAGEKIYTGSPLQSILRVRSRIGKQLFGGLTYEKDAGETVLYRNKPQFLSGYFAYKGKGLLQQVVIGTFKLSHGLGLVNGLGFFHDPAFLQINQRTLSVLKPYASKTEHSYERGLACQMGWRSMEILLWGSFTRGDLSTEILLENPRDTDWWSHQKNTGLYRSRNEMEGRDLAKRMYTGVELLYRNGELAMGIMAGAERLTLTSYQSHIQKNASIHGTWLRDSWNIFGELAMGDGPTIAFQAGTSVQINDFLKGTLLLHHCDKEYDGIHPSSYPSGNQLKHQQGLAFHMQMETGPVILLNASGEILHYPSPRHGCLVPSFAYRFGLILENPGMGSLNWRISLKKKMWQNTADVLKAGIRPLRESSLTRMDLRFQHKDGNTFEWQSRLVFSFLSRNQAHKPAYAFLQEARLQLTPLLTGRIQCVLFHVEDWENRIYLHEPGFYYSFNFPAYYGKGQKTTVLITLKALKAFVISCKVSGISYRNRKTLGSGNDLIRGNKRWETGLQIRIIF